MIREGVEQMGPLTEEVKQENGKEETRGGNGKKKCFESTFQGDLKYQPLKANSDDVISALNGIIFETCCFS